MCLGCKIHIVGQSSPVHGIRELFPELRQGKGAFWGVNSHLIKPSLCPQKKNTASWQYLVSF